MCRLLPRSAAHTLDPIACADCSGYCKHDPEADVQRVVQQSHTQRLTRDSNALVGARLRARGVPGNAPRAQARSYVEHASMEMPAHLPVAKKPLR
ncbi:hypothetical protein XCCB100_4485 [Xanthomonas campestris pv. campestris]|uniref:Uncharacterized protein n=1 Tax=Xanthomonas campestris pv. campestris (strain B100) TaxID=509169 RepID=A0A1X7QG04_XANCB|nr:hypothetical protein XCCB100_4485 [Xanthomonas campestris pv. campestris]